MSVEGVEVLTSDVENVCQEPVGDDYLAEGAKEDRVDVRDREDEVSLVVGQTVDYISN